MLSQVGMLMIYRIFFTFFLAVFLTCFSAAQMIVGQDTLVGNEWIRYGQRYFKFSIDQDGVYRISAQSLINAGVDLNSIAGEQFRIYNKGKQVPIVVTNDGFFEATDYIEFYGHRNRGELDRYLFRKPDADMLQPDHSLYTDRNPYYLTFDGDDIPLRTITLPNDLTNPPAPQPYYWHREIISFTATLHDPYFPVSGGGAASYSSYMHGEGFASASATNSTTSVPADHMYTNGPSAQLHLRLASSNIGLHRFEVAFNGTPLDTLFCTDLSIQDMIYDVPISLVSNTNEVKVNNLSINSRHVLVKVDLLYPRLPVLPSDNVSLVVAPESPEEKYFSLSGFDHNSISPLVYTNDGAQRMVAATSGADEIQFIWPAGTGAELIIHDQSAIMDVDVLQEKIFIDFSADDTEFIVITHPDLMETGTASPYIQYRQSVDGGGYKAKAYSILDLYDEFGYGIEKHPQAIRNFVEYVNRHWTSAKMFFIIGRGIEYNRSRYENGQWEDQFFVPTFGRPGSDLLLTATNWNLLSRYPIGRLAVINSQSIDDYLEKVKEHDASRFTEQTLEAKTWIKNLMHLGGGKDADEQASFKAVLDNLAEKLIHSDYGARYHFFQKTSTEPVGESQTTQILRLLNEGCGIINYLGHSASSTLEFSINDPVEWNNKGRYPIFSAMGCSAGQIHNTTHSLSDSYVLLADEGAIAFISGSGSQYAAPLATWSRPWYDFIGELNYEGTLGESILFGLAEVAEHVNVNFDNTNQYRYLLEQQTLQGDPALRFHPMPGPDYLIDATTVSFEPDVLSTRLDSFDLSFTIANIGRNIGQDITYNIQIRKPDGQLINVKEEVVNVSTFTVPVQTRVPLAIDGKEGAYRLLITLDPSNTIQELPTPEAEANNSLTNNLGIEGIEFIVVDHVVNAAYPPDYAIVTEISPQLIVTSSNAFIQHQNIVAEIDTTPFFNSPVLLRQHFDDHGAVLKWEPSYNFIPDQEYYWRVSTDSMAPDQSYFWSRRSFLYKPGYPHGWNQSDFFQLTDNRLEYLRADTAGTQFVFQSGALNYNIINRVQDNAVGIFPQMKVDNIVRNAYFAGFGAQHIHVFVVAIDSVTGQPLRNPNPGLYGSVNHLSFDAPCFPFPTDTPEGRQNLINFVENIIPSGYYVFIYTYQRANYMDYFPQQWADDEVSFGKSIFSLVEDQYPNAAIRTLANGSVPYVVFFQKDRGGIIEMIALNLDDAITYSWDAAVSLSEGNYVSSLVGPASSWSRIEWNAADYSGDESHFRLSARAFNADLSDTILISANILSADTTISSLDAAQYPYIQLQLNTMDSVSFRPADVVYWRVLYDGYPELIINSSAGFEYVNDTLYQGEMMKLTTYIENISHITSGDSVDVSLRLLSSDNTSAEKILTIDTLTGGQSSVVQFDQSTASLAGAYQVVVEVNPAQEIKELNYANNIGILPLLVQDDKINPVLDVTFDGYHILDGDLVSSKPVILIRLHDENPYLRLDDTSTFVIFLKHPSAFDPERISFSEDWVTFHAAGTSGKNEASVELNPELLEDGIYELQVSAKDASGNISGDNNYTVSFEVINESSISNLYNYPNPFSTATRFVYTLTGDASPEYYTIRIMSISGRVVREITHEELGPLAVGTHMTDYVWDGTDEYGERLAAGTYLYRLYVKDDKGEDYKKLERSQDETFFKKGWGKLVILR